MPNVISSEGRLYLRMHLTPGIGPMRARTMLEHFGTLDDVFGARVAELTALPGIGSKTARSLLESSEDPAEREVEHADREGVRLLCPADSEYPLPLSRITDPPLCLYVRGQLCPTDAVAIGIVGTRRCSFYAKEQAQRFADALATTGFTIVSGLARGIDGIAHAAAMKAGGRTLAVLGNGLPKVYPSEHGELAEGILASGALVSEYPMATGPHAENFPRRNRIIAGLALGVMVIEAGRRSGALITARLAQEYNREVFAVPGRIDRPDQTDGVNGLIRDGSAKLVMSLDDVLDELDAIRKALCPPDERADAAVAVPDLGGLDLSENERAVLSAILADIDTPEQLAENTGLAPGSLMSTLTALELKGTVVQRPGQRFIARGRKKSQR